MQLSLLGGGRSIQIWSTGGAIALPHWLELSWYTWVRKKVGIPGSEKKLEYLGPMKKLQ